MISNEFQNLVDKGKKQGFLLFSDVNDAISYNLEDTEKIEEIIYHLQQLGIKLFDEEKIKHIEQITKSQKISFNPKKNPGNRIISLDPYINEGLKKISKYKELYKFDKIIPYLKDDSPLLRRQAATTIGKLNNEHFLVPMSELLNDNDLDVKKTAVRFLIKLDNPQSIKYLIPHLKDKDKEFKALISLALGFFGESIAYSNLVELVTDSEIYKDFRIKILQALCVIGDKRCVPILLKSLTETTFNDSEKAYILKFLHLIPDKSFIPILIDFTEHPNAKIKMLSILNLCRLNHNQGFVLLKEYLDAPNTNLRIGAIKNLLYFGGKKYIDKGFEKLYDSEGLVQRAAMNSIIQCTKNEFKLISILIPKLNLNHDYPSSNVSFNLNFKILRYINYLQKNEVTINFDLINIQIVCKLLNFIGYLEEKNYVKKIMLEKDYFPKVDKFIEKESIDDLLDDFDEEDIRKIRAKFQYRPKQRSYRDKTFRRYGASCAVCGMKIKSLLEAAHIISKKDRGADDPRNGLVLCNLHHKAYDSGLFAIEPNSLKILCRKKGPNINDLRITYRDISHLNKKPNPDILRWKWEKWEKLYNIHG